MGRATRWLKGLFGIKKKYVGNPSEVESSTTFTYTNSASGLIQIPAIVPPDLSPAEAAWLRSFFNDNDKEQSKHAIAVAAATAAAADAAVEAAQAAARVVRLTSQSQGRGTMFGGGREWWAAVRIQTFYRGYLARKALRALKGLVKLQAHVRGYLVRRQATATLHGMQALFRAQATVLFHRGRYNNKLLLVDDDNLPRPEIGARKSMEKFDDARSELSASVHSSRRLSGSLDATISNSVDESPKIVEVDTFSGICRPKSRSRRTNVSSVSDFGDELPYHVLSSPSPYPSGVPPRLSIPERQGTRLHSEWELTGDECRFSTAHSTPRFASFCGANYSGGGPITPAKSLCGDGYFRQYGNSPSYMANTKSFKAKLRSLSAPKQRPEIGGGGGGKKRLSLNEMMESRNSLSGVKMQRSCSQIQQAISFKNAVMGKLDRSFDFEREN